MASLRTSGDGVDEGEPVVIYRLGSLGDTIVSLPCFHLIARIYSGRKRIVLTNRPVSTVAAPLESILGDCGLIDSVIEYPVNLRSLASILDLRRRLRSSGSRTLVYLAADRGQPARIRDYLFFRWCGFNKIIGLPLGRVGVPQMPAGVDEQPEVERLAARLQTLGDIDLNDRSYWDLRLADGEKQAARTVLRGFPERFFAINMGGKVSVKDWGRENWAQLIARLGAMLPPMGLVVVGAAEDAERAVEITACWPHASISVCGGLSPRESAAVLSSAKFFVGHDSGALHLAAAMGVPCVGLFGSYNRPRQWHPFGKQHNIIHEVGGMQNISIGQVVRAVVELIS